MAAALVGGCTAARRTTALLCAPRQDDGHLLRQDVMQHRVTDFNTVAQPPAGPAAMLLGQHDTDTDAGYLVWQVAGQQRRHVDFATAKVVLSELSDLELPQETSDLGIVQNRMADATGVHAVGMSDPVPVIVLGCLLFGTALLGVLGAPPQTGSRWYWIWIIGILGGLGVLWFAARELWRGGDGALSRRGGWRGFLIACLANSILATARGFL